MQTLWCSQSRKNLLCVDSYQDGVPQGWLYSPLQGGTRFLSLSQLLLSMEALLEENRTPQAYTVPRRFSPVPEPDFLSQPFHHQPKGHLATFELSVFFRQHTSWQGVLKWRDTGMEQSFRSVLELVLLMDSALRFEAEGGA